MAGSDPLRGEIIRRLRALNALKAGALRVFDPMLTAVDGAREQPELAEVADLLKRMHGNFVSHREQTADHTGQLAVRIEELGSRRARGRVALVGIGAAVRARIGTIGGMDFGAGARDAFVFEHLEIAQSQLIEQLATRADDTRTAELVAGIRAGDEEMAAVIGRNWTNVLSLALATRGLPVLRPEAASGS